MIPDLDLSLLKTFAAIVDEGGLTAAGKVVGRTQPAITHQLRRLERLVGHKLIVVGRRSLALTHNGEILLGYARNILRLNDEARARISAPDVEGRVVLGVPDLYASLLPDILRSFSQAYPRIEVELRFTRSIHLHAALKRKEIDLALVIGSRILRAGASSASSRWSGSPPCAAILSCSTRCRLRYYR